MKSTFPMLILSMKNVAFFAAIAIFICACDSKSYMQIENPKQAEFEAFLLEKSEFKVFSNDIKRDEFYENYDKELMNFLDTNKIFVNWKGQVSNIQKKEQGGYVILGCEIVCEPSEYKKTTFKCLHSVKKEDSADDYLLNQLKNIDEYSVVYFDGFVSRDLKGKVNYSGYLNDPSMQISYPDYYFKLVKISTQKTSNSLSENLKSAVNINFQVANLLRQKINGVITEKEWKQKMDRLNLSTFDKNLTPEEKGYSDRIKEYALREVLVE